MSKKKWIIIISSLVVIITITMTILFSTYLRANLILFRLSISNSNPQYYQRIEPIYLKFEQTLRANFFKSQLRLHIPSEYKYSGMNDYKKKLIAYSYASGDKNFKILIDRDFDSKQFITLFINDKTINDITDINEFENDYEYFKYVFQLIPDDIHFIDSDNDIRSNVSKLIIKNMLLTYKRNIAIYESDKYDFVYCETVNTCHVEVYNKQQSKNVKFLFRNLKKEEILEIVKTISFE